MISPLFSAFSLSAPDSSPLEKGEGSRQTKPSFLKKFELASLTALLSRWGSLPYEIVFVTVVALSLWVHGIGLIGDFRIDDAYITFAYSKNVALGKGPIYGYDLQVEGYSNFLWMMLIAAGEAIGQKALFASRFLGHLFFGIVLGAVWLVARKWGGRVAALLVVTCLAANSDFHRAIQSGLETVAFSAFIAAGLCHYSLEDPSKRRYSLLWLSGAALTRIDGFVPFFLLLGLEAVAWLGSKRRGSILPLLRWASVGILPVAVYWIWRYNYYGLAFPLPYYAKASLGIETSDRGIEYVWAGLRDTSLWLGLLFSAFALGRMRNRAMYVVALFCCVLCGYVVYVGGDWMPLNRMLLPIVPPLMMCFAAGLGQLFEAFAAEKVWRRAGAYAVGVVAVAFVGAHFNQEFVLTPHESGKLGAANHTKSHTLSLVGAAPFVRALIRKPGDKLVTDYGGVFAYETEASVIEMWGLANREIALRGNTDGIHAIYGKTCIACYPEFDPDYFHPGVPLIRGPKSFKSMSDVISKSFQGAALNRVLNYKKNYVVGRVLLPRTQQAFWFLERKRDGRSLARRNVGEFVVEYPFLHVRAGSRPVRNRARRR